MIELDAIFLIAEQRLSLSGTELPAENTRPVPER
jgi:hypothetical protein